MKQIQIQFPLFDTKDQYFSMRSHWAQNCRNILISSSHMVLYNMLRRKPPSCGFTPITNKIKLANGARPNDGFVEAMRIIGYYAARATEPSQTGWFMGVQTTSGSTVARFLEPFGDTVTPQMLIACYGAYKESL